MGVDTGLRGGPRIGGPTLTSTLGALWRGFRWPWLLLPRLLSSSWLSVIPQAPPRKGGLALWRGCTQPGEVLACPASTLLSQLKKTFLHRVRGKYPGQLEIGSVLLTCPVPGEGQDCNWGTHILGVLHLCACLRCPAPGKAGCEPLCLPPRVVIGSWAGQMLSRHPDSRLGSS